MVRQNIPCRRRESLCLLTTVKGGDNIWNEKLIIDPGGPGAVRTFDPQEWIAPVSKLGIFWAQCIGHIGTIAGVCAIIS